MGCRIPFQSLIEGAHTGVGLGDRFLGHAERTKMILHIIDGTESDWAGRYAAIRFEMEMGIDMKKIMGVLVLFIACSFVMCACDKSRETLELSDNIEAYRWG